MRAMHNTSNDQPPRPRSTRTTGILSARWAILAAPFVLAGCQAAVLDPKGVVGLAQRTILIDSLAIMLAIVLPTMAATAAFAWWFRASNTRAKYLPDFVHSGSIEIIVWAIPLLTIILLGGVTWIAAHDLDPARPLDSKTPALEVQGISLDWKWLFIYPDKHIASVNQLVVPAGTPIHFSLTSASVMNAFFIPSLGSMIYTMNGMTTQLNLQADAPGTFHGLSSHYSGDGFSDMHFNVRAVPSDQFDIWVNTMRGIGNVLDRGSYVELAKQTINVSPFTYRDVDPALFQQIVTQQIPPGPGPETSQLNASVHPRPEN